MINIICNTNNSLIVFLEVNGHASNNINNNVICAAVSCLTRTVCEITTRLKGVTSDCSAPNPGNVMLSIHNVEITVQEMFSGVTDFLLIGLIGIKRDYPESIKLKINNKEWYDGSQKRWW
ncbi:MAG: ribosomal-processing cysteine protease Prp [Spirochaetaceae bacterium]